MTIRPTPASGITIAAITGRAPVKSSVAATTTNNCFYWIPTHTALGPALCLTEEKIQHRLDDPLPEGVYEPDEAAIVRYPRKATRMKPIDKATFGKLARHFDAGQIVDLCLTVGISNLVNHFRVTFLTDVDKSTLAELEAGNREPGVCPIPLPRRPAS